MTESATVSLPRIVVGVDGSVPSKHALRWAYQVAAATGAVVEAIAVWPSAIAYRWALPEWSPDRDTARVLQTAVLETPKPSPDVVVEQIVREGNPAHVLIERSATATMLVVGSRGRGGFTSLLLGSVSSAVAEHARCPVLVIHGEGEPPPVR